MLIVYASRTGNVRRFLNKTKLPSVEITEGLLIEEPFILVTYTDKYGEVPANVQTFLHYNQGYIRGVAASGNRNWGEYFARSADVVSEHYHVPVLHKFELSGMTSDVKYFKKRVEEINETCRIK